MKLSDKQLKLVDAQIKRIIKTDSFYGKKYRELGITGCECEEDFKKLPFSSKDELRLAYPLGIQAVDDKDVVRIHSSSGTTGKPVIIPYTQKDVDDWATMFARCYETAGINKTDRIQITPGYGLWTAGIGFQAGCEKLGAMAVPMGPGNTEKQLQMMIDLKTTVIAATSSYALLLSEEITKRGLRDQIFLKKGVIGSERWSETMRQTIRRNLGISLYDIYGLTEIYGPGIGISCDEENGMHYWDDYIFIEIIDPDNRTEMSKDTVDPDTGELLYNYYFVYKNYKSGDSVRIKANIKPDNCTYPDIKFTKDESDTSFKIDTHETNPNVEKNFALITLTGELETVLSTPFFVSATNPGTQIKLKVCITFVSPLLS